MYRRHPIVALIVGALFALSDAAKASQPAGERDSTTQIIATGRIVDSQGRPVEGAKVTLYRLVYTEAVVSSPKVEIVHEGSTARDGTFSLTFSRNGDPYSIIVRKNGLGLGWATWQAGKDHRFDIVLGEPKDLAGDVVDEKGQPIVDAEVDITVGMMGRGEDWRILSLPGFPRTRADENRHFVFTDMPGDATFELCARKAGRVTVDTLAQATFLDSSLGRNDAQTADEQFRRQFSPGQTGIKLVLPPAAVLEGIAVDKASGKAVAGVEVAAGMDQMMEGFMPPDPATTAEDGTFRIGGLAAGRRTVQLTLPGGQAAKWAAEPVRVSLKAGETRSGIRLELTKGGITEVVPTIEGTVRDEAGNPLAGVKVAVTPVAPLEVATDVNGKFTISLPLRLRHPSVIPYVLVGRDITRNQAEAVEVGEQTEGIELTLKAGTIFTGTVVDHQGKAVAGADVRVMLERPKGGIPFLIVRATTGEDGKFEINAIPRGRQYTLTVTANGYDMRHEPIQASTRENSRQNVGLFRLALADLSISGIVVDSLGEPIAGATVSLVGRSRFPGSTVKTGADGRFVLTGAPAGVIPVRASVRRSTWLLGSVETEGGATDVRIVLSE